MPARQPVLLASTVLTARLVMLTETGYSITLLIMLVSQTLSALASTNSIVWALITVVAPAISPALTAVDPKTITAFTVRLLLSVF